MENKFDKINEFVASLERTSLNEEQQSMLLAGFGKDDTTTIGYNHKNCSNNACTGMGNGNCLNVTSCSGINETLCYNNLPCGGSNGNSCTNTGPV